MSDVEIRLGVRPYDPIAPLLLGMIPTPGIRIVWTNTVEVGDARNVLLKQDDPGLPNVAEMSFNRYVADYAHGDSQMMGLPAFILKSFRHRYWFVRQDSPLESFADIRGRKVGNDSWNDSGNMWARAAMRDAGVGLPDVHWTLGRINPTVVLKPKFATDTVPPGDWHRLADDDNLMDALREKRIDVLTTAHTPDSVFETGGEFRRLLRDYRAAERDYHRRKGFRPVMHLLATNRTFGERHPEAILALQGALKASWELWWARYKRFPDATPWAVEGVESFIQDFRDEMPPYGTESPAHRRMLEDVCREQYEQKLVPAAADPEALFAGFNGLR